MEQLLISLDKLLKYKNEDPSRFYTYLSNYKICGSDEKYFVENFIPKVYALYEKQILQKDLVYLSLLASQNFDTLEKFINYDKSVFVLNIEDPVSLYDYFVYEQKHWLYEVINNPSAYDKLIPLKSIYNKLNMIKYITITNSSNINIEQLQTMSPQIDDEYLDEFWKYYIQEVNRFIDIVQFCKTTTQTNADDNELFRFASNNTLLNTLSTYTNLKDSTQWENILCKIRDHMETEQLNVFTGYIIIATLVNLLIHNSYSTSLKKDFVNTLLDNMKNKLIELQDKHLQIELLENIFCLLFYRSGTDFACKEKEVRFVLFLLKTVMDKLKLKKVYDKDSDEYKRLSTLNVYVADAIWRLDLIVNIKIAPKIEDQLVNYMLAPPESLIHLCLKRENFERAYQVIEVSL
ncbi:hypothetical protein BDFB_007511 [Asbolus verrucosus]|uniref:Uncharacterized protein n=1 Tax=Asbolus verrucosus TaxID=1661398 RepID=A0A482W3T5_ASBVE|nr:hypothetical protein BDFB_007511 [Asbolus verrucosus]